MTLRCLQKLCLFTVVCLLFCSGAINPYAHAENDGSNPDQKIQRFKINIGKLREGIRAHLAKIRESGEKENNLLDELAQIDEKITVQKQRLAALQERLTAQEELLILKEQDLEKAKIKKENVRKHLEKRLRSFYTMGNTGFLNIAFSTQNLPDLLTFNDSYMRLLEYDQSVIDMFRDTIYQLEKAKETLELEKSLLDNFISQTEKEKKVLTDIKEQKQQLLAKIRTQKNLYKEALKELRKAEERLTNTLITLKREKSSKTHGFVINKGKLMAPVSGKIIRRFGESRDKDSSDIDRSKGITIETVEDIPVKAIFSGQVLFAGYMKGYGNLVIIDHGLQYFSITSRLDSIFCKENDHVRVGDIIGKTGDIATLFDKGLYFEIRHGSQALDPLDWINVSDLQKDIPQENN